MVKYFDVILKVMVGIVVVLSFFGVVAVMASELIGEPSSQWFIPESQFAIATGR